MTDAEALARRFHETYERLAPSMGYRTRESTRNFDPETRNGKLMIAVCAELLALLPAQGEAWRPISEAPKDGTPVDLWVEWPAGSGPDKLEAHGSRYTDSCFDVGAGEWALGASGFRESQYTVKPTIARFRPLPPPPKPEVAG